MKKVLSIFDKYSFCLWGLVILLVSAIMLVPFIPGTIFTLFGIRVFYTPALILSPILMGIIYAILVSYETPKMSEKKKNVFRVIKAVDFLLFYALTIAVIVTAIVRGVINF